MIQEIESPREVIIRKQHTCHHCERKFEKGSTMVSSVWKDDDVYRIYECQDCIQYIKDNPKDYQEVCENESCFPGWIRDCEPLPLYLS